MLPTDSASLPIQLVRQHARDHERMFRMQRVRTTHTHQIGRANRLGHIVDAATVDPVSCAWPQINRVWVESIIALHSASSRGQHPFSTIMLEREHAESWHARPSDQSAAPPKRVVPPRRLASRSLSGRSTPSPGWDARHRWARSAHATLALTTAE